MFHPPDALRSDGDLDQLRDQVQRLSADSVLADTDASFRWLARRNVTADSVAATGVMRPLSETLPPLVDAAPELRCPWLGIFGVDEQVPEEEVHKLRNAAASADVATDLVHFPRRDDRFDDEQASVQEAWTRTLNWFDSHMR